MLLKNKDKIMDFSKLICMPKCVRCKNADERIYIGSSKRPMVKRITERNSDITKHKIGTVLAKYCTENNTKKE